MISTVGTDLLHYAEGSERVGLWRASGSRFSMIPMGVWPSVTTAPTCPTAPGQVGQGEDIMAIDPPGEAAAKRAGALGRRGHGDDGDSVGCGQDLHDRQTCWDQRWKTVGQRGKSDLWMCQSHVAPGRATSYPTAPEARLNPNRDPPPHGARPRGRTASRAPSGRRFLPRRAAWAATPRRAYIGRTTPRIHGTRRSGRN